MEYLKQQFVLALIENVIENKLRKLNLASKSLNDIPRSVVGCRTLRKLFLQNNRITAIPDAICLALDNVHTLILAGNALREFPAAILGMPKLRMLNISNNDIGCIPAEIGRLAQLEVLWCNRTGLSALPDEIGELLELDTFGARDNQIRQLPRTIGRLKKLRWLTLQNNHIARLPYPFTQLKYLLHLNLRQNQLTRIPMQLYFMPTLKYCWLNDNRIEVVSDEDVNKTYFMKMLALNGNPLLTATLASNRHICVQDDAVHDYGHSGDDDAGQDDSMWMNSVPSSALNTDSDEWNVVRPATPNAIRQSSRFCS